MPKRKYTPEEIVVKLRQVLALRESGRDCSTDWLAVCAVRIERCSG